MKGISDKKWGEEMGWLLFAILAGLWSGLLLPWVWRSWEAKRQQAAGKAAEQAQDLLLTEWLYGGDEEN